MTWIPEWNHYIQSKEAKTIHVHEVGYFCGKVDLGLTSVYDIKLNETRIFASYAANKPIQFTRTLVE